MCSGGVTVTIIGVDVDAAVEPILTLFSGSNLEGNGVSGTSYIMSLRHCFKYISNCTTS